MENKNFIKRFLTTFGMTSLVDYWEVKSKTAKPFLILPFLARSKSFRMERSGMRNLTPLCAFETPLLWRGWGRCLCVPLWLIIFSFNLQAQQPDRDALHLSPLFGYPISTGNVTIGDTVTWYINQLVPDDVDLVGLSKFQIGVIPNQTVWHDGDNSIHFYVKDTTVISGNVNFDFTIDGLQPENYPFLDPNTGRFKYEPGKFDISDFAVLFTSHIGNDTISRQAVRFRVMPATPPEFTAFGMPNTSDPPSGDDYTIITSSTRNNTNFNNETRTVFEYNISGKDLIFDRRIENELQDFILLDRENIIEINLYAERVIIREALRFKQTNVTIYAKELVFEDRVEGNNTIIASINTTPLEWDPTPANDNGGNGENAGNITLYIKEFKHSSPQTRFIANGAGGQNCAFNYTPGDGGNGGLVTSIINLKSYCEYKRGRYGLKYNVNNVIIAAGEYGDTGDFYLENKPFEWLHPNFISAVVKHGKDAYLELHNGLVYNIFEEYVEILDEYIQTFADWNLLSAAEREKYMELNNANVDMQSIMSRISQNMDYFGNPAGWVPMLSFEVNLLAFKQEIERAIRVLYFSYWLNEIASDNDQKREAMIGAITLLREDLVDNRALINELETLISYLNDNTEILQDEITALIGRINETVDHLVAQAQHNVKKKEKFNFISGVLNVVANVAPVIPGWGTAIGIAASVGNNILGKVTGASDVYGWGDAAGGFLNAANGFFQGGDFTDIKTALNGINFSTVGDYNNTAMNAYNTISDKVNPLIASVGDLRNAFMQSAVPSDQVQAELDKLKSESKEFQHLIAEAEVLNSKKEVLMQKLCFAFDKIYSTSAEVQNNIAAIDGLTADVFNNSSTRDLRAMQYLDNMERRAKDRLLQYHYYMAKAYEYRMLTEYKDQLNLNAMFERFATIAQGNPEQSMLTEAQYSLLGETFKAQLASVASDIVTYFNSNNPEMTNYIDIALSEKELEILNAGGGINMNIFERGLIFTHEENVRIVGFTIEKLVVRREDGLPTDARFDLLMEHSGISRLRNNGEIYYFNHINSQSENPIVWGHTYRSSNNTYSTWEHSAASYSLLYTLLGVDENTMLYSRPGAWADIRVSKEGNASNNAKMVIEELIFELQYDYMVRPSGFRNLDVFAQDIDGNDISLAPFIYVSLIDRNQRASGRPLMHRTYTTGRTTQITAPEWYGNWKFVEWRDFDDYFVSNQTTINVRLDNDEVRRAMYRYAGPELEAPKTVWVLNEGDLKIINVTSHNTTYEDLVWNVKVSTDYDWITLDEDAYYVNSKSFTIDCAPNPNQEDRIGSITITSDDESLEPLIVIIRQSENVSIKEEQFKGRDLKIYPNPITNGELIVESGELLAGDKIEIYNMTGTRLGIYEAKGSVTAIDFSGYAAGKYVVKAGGNAAVVIKN